MSNKNKYPKFTKERKKAMRELYELCQKNHFTIEGVAGFDLSQEEYEDDASEDFAKFEIGVNAAGVEMVAKPYRKHEEEHPGIHFIYSEYSDNTDGKWVEGLCFPLLTCPSL
jgi:hypothetical protein